MPTWEIEAQVEGGKVERGTITTKSDANRDYLVRRFLHRHIQNPGRVEYWFYQNKTRAKVRRVSESLDRELPSPWPEF